MTPDDEYSHVDLRAAIATTRLLLARLERADGRQIPPRQAGRARSAELADLTKELLLLQHLANRAGVQVLDEYHVARGFTEHIEASGL